MVLVCIAILSLAFLGVALVAICLHDLGLINPELELMGIVLVPILLIYTLVILSSPQLQNGNVWGICILFSGYFDAIRLAAIKVIDFYCECTLGITQHPWTFSWLQRNRFGGLPRVDWVGRLFAFIYDIVCVSDCDLGAGRRGEEQGVIGRCYALICQGVPKGYRV